MSMFGNILHALHDIISAHFWRNWITLTAAAAICVAWAVWQPVPIRSQRKGETNRFTTWRQVTTPGALAAVALLAAFLAFYIVMTLAWEDFAFYDDSDFTLSTLKGHQFGIMILRDEGRFLPLAGQEFNLIRHFTDTITGYHVWLTVQLLILVCILLILDDELSIGVRATLAILALLTPSILISFNALQAYEHSVLFFLVCLLLSVKRFEQTQSTAWAVAAVVCAQIMIYYKESAFLLLLGFAVGGLILRCKSAQNANWDYYRLCDREGRLNLCLAGVAVLFLLFYLSVMGIHGNMNYAKRAREPLVEVVVSYVRVDLLAWLLVAVALRRTYLILWNRVPALPFWDGLAFGGMACLLAYIYLGMFAPVYMAPVDLIAILYVGRFAVLSLKTMHSWEKVTALLLTFTVLIQYVSLSALAVFERKNGIHAKVQIAQVVGRQYRSHAGNPLRLFFPFANPYVIMEFASYLSYRGVPVEGAEDQSTRLHDVILAARAVAKDGPCMWYRSIRCRAANGPAPGDLVIVLPDDEASREETSMYREQGEQLLAYEPSFLIPRWFRLFVGDLHILAPRYRHETLPDRWMDASVTIWK